MEERYTRVGAEEPVGKEGNNCIDRWHVQDALNGMESRLHSNE